MAICSFIASQVQSGTHNPTKWYKQLHTKLTHKGVKRIEFFVRTACAKEEGVDQTQPRMSSGTHSKVSQYPQNAIGSMYTPQN